MATTPTPAPMAPATSRRRGEMNFSLRRLNEPLELQQVALDPIWNKFKTVMVFVGGVLFFLVFGTMMFWLGGGSRSTAASTPQVQVIAPTSAVQPAPAPQPSVPRWSSRDECERHYALVLRETPGSQCP